MIYVLSVTLEALVTFLHFLVLQLYLYLIENVMFTNEIICLAVMCLVTLRCSQISHHERKHESYSVNAF